MRRSIRLVAAAMVASATVPAQVGASEHSSKGIGQYTCTHVVKRVKGQRRRIRFCGAKNRLFTDPRGIAVDGQDNVYVSDAARDRIFKLSPQGKLLAVWGGPGSAPGRLDWPERVRIDALGNMYVVEGELGLLASGTGRIQKLSPSGRPLAHWTFNRALGFAVDMEGNMYVADYMNNLVVKLDPTGRRLVTWGHGAQVAFRGPMGLALDRHGNIYVADSDNERVVKLSPLGDLLTQWGGLGNRPGQFVLPEGVAVDPQGNVYVADMSNSRIQKFSADGTPLAQWGGEGRAPDQFYGPFDIALDSHGNIYVTDPVPLNGARGDNRVQEFSSTGQILAVWQ